MAGLSLLHRFALSWIGRDEEDRLGWTPARQLRNQAGPVEAGHHHVDDHEVHRPRALQNLERLLAVLGLEDPIAGIAQVPLHDSAHNRVVVHDEHGRGR